MKTIKCVLSLLLIFFGFIFLFGGEILTTAWVIYEGISLFKNEVLTFSAVLWLVLLYMLRGICVGLTGVFFIFVGLGIGGTVK